MTPEARALLDDLAGKFAGGTVTFARVENGRQGVVLSGGASMRPHTIGWIEHCVQADPTLPNAHRQGLSVETDGESMLVLRFWYRQTAVRISSRPGTEPEDGERTDSAEIRAALDLRPLDKGPLPRVVWVTRQHEVATMTALRSRDYEAFYVRFKQEVLAGLWGALSGFLSNSPASKWHEGSHYTVVCEPHASLGRIHQRTVDDSGRAGDIGLDRIYDAISAADILLLYLEGDILADLADIYFTLRSLSSADGYFLKEEFFTIIRRFWADARSLTSSYGGDHPTVMRLSRRAVPMPAQARLVKQDWTNLRQLLVDRYGEGGKKATDLVSRDSWRPRVGRIGWPFAVFPTGSVNIGLRLVYRQELASSDREGSRETIARLGEISVGPHPHDALRRPVEIQSVVMVAERLPRPAEIGRSWVRRHDWILSAVLLDESFREALQSIGQEPRKQDARAKLDAKRERLYEHLRDNVLHYQRRVAAGRCPAANHAIQEIAERCRWSATELDA